MPSQPGKGKINKFTREGTITEGVKMEAREPQETLLKAHQKLELHES